jgi:hypothetical protein
LNCVFSQNIFFNLINKKRYFLNRVSTKIENLDMCLFIEKNKLVFK